MHDKINNKIGPTTHSATIAGLVAVWLIAAGAALVVGVRFEMTPGAAGSPPPQFPPEWAPEGGADRATLVMFAHPRCPCTRASIGELREILESHPGIARVRIVFRTPADASAEWTGGELWDDAAALPAATVVADPDGATARRLHVKTSGHVLLYGADGRLLFSGGITGARGHSGLNAGRRAVAALLAGQQAQTAETAVYGCPLFETSCSLVRDKSCPVQ